MQILPAIDLRGGKCVRLRQGDYAQETVFGDDPVAMALRWEAEGGDWLHLVDLDGAKAGKPVNVDVIRKIVKSLKIPCELGGGIRTEETVRQMLEEVGVKRVIIGTQALKQPEWFRGIVERFPNQVCLGLDARNSMVATEGWLDVSQTSALELARQYVGLPLAAVIYTNIANDGMMQGIDDGTLADFRALARMGLKVIASGGVTTLEDIRKLRDISLEEPNLVGAITGRAIYEGTVTVPEAVKIARGKSRGISQTWKKLDKDWCSIYQWSPVASHSRIAEIADLITNEFNSITVNYSGLRQRLFRTPNHRGQADVNSGGDVFNEKRLVRALYNMKRVDVLGEVLDYEVPLKERRDSPHGKIDLLTRMGESVFLVEAKQPGSKESILKAILEAFTYTSLVASVKKAFFGEYCLSESCKLTPVILTCREARSGQQLAQLKGGSDSTELIRLVRLLNGSLRDNGANPLRFFLIENSGEQMRKSLHQETAINGDQMIKVDGLQLAISEMKIAA